MDMQTNRFLITLLALVAVLAIAACTPTQAQARFSYHYKRPEALGPMPKEVSVAIPNIAPEKALEHGEQKALRLAKALGIKLDPRDTARRVDAHNEILTLRDGRYHLKIYVPSGMVKLRDTKLYNQEPEDQKTLTALDNEAALKMARQTLDKLSQHELIQLDQLLIDAARFSNRKARGNPGRKPDQTGRPKPGPVEIMDTRIFVPRAINGLGVSGHGVRIVLDKHGEIAGLDLLWRELKLEDRKLPAKLTMAEAIKRFETELKVSSNAQVDVIANELIYFDPSMRDPVAFLEPGYLFVYQARVPIKGRDEFRVSKLLHQLIPAVDHGLKQFPSPRKERLQKLHREIELPRPDKIMPVPDKEEKEKSGL